MGTPAKRELRAFVSCCMLWTILLTIAADATDTSEKGCSRGFYMCKKEKKCIPDKWRCDGYPDCMMDDDEPLEECRSWKRFGPHTKDQGDELKPPACVPNQFRCGGTAQCIPIRKLCDGVKDCEKDWADESYECTRIHIQGNACDKTTCPLEGGCRLSSEGPQCFCNPDGYMVDPKNPAQCIDLDECLYEGYCDQKCKNSVGNYTCSCVDGYVLNTTDSKTCKPINTPYGEPATIFYQTLNSIRQISIDGSPLSNAFSLSAERIQAMDLNHYNQSVCWIEMTSRPERSDTASLYCAMVIDVRQRRQIQTTQALNNVADMSHDWVTNNWYFTDKVALRILLCSGDGRLCRTLVYMKNETPAHIRVDPLAGYLFLTTTGRTPTIKRMSLAGTDATTLIDKALIKPRGLMLDYANRHVYWSDNSYSRIQRVNYDGTNRRSVISGSWVNSIYSLSILGNWIYGADPVSNSIVKFHRREEEQTAVPEVVKSSLNYTAAINIYHRQRQPVIGQQPCDKTECEHFCVPLATPQNKTVETCLCLEGWIANGTKCLASHPDVFLLYTSSRIGMIRGIDLVSKEDVMLPVDGLDGPVSLAVHAQEKMIYYSSVFHGKIGRRRLDGKMRNDSYISVGGGIRKSEGIAIDWIGRNIYWTDKADRTITVAKIDNPDIRRVVVTDSPNFYPRKVTVDPIGRFIYWTSWSSEEAAEHMTRIMAARLDGSQQRVLSSSETHSQYWPNGFALSQDGSTLYWLEAYYDHIQAINLTSDSSEILNNSRIQHPFSLSYSDGALYWTEMTSIMKLNLTSNKTDEIQSDSSGLFDVTVYNESGQPMKGNDCGLCSDLCLRASKTCYCGIGRIASTNNNTCVSDPTHSPTKTCASNEFSCGDNSCIDISLKCNGVIDCPQGRDEDRNSTCADHKCPDPDHMHQCTNNKCVPLRWLCDGEDDCQSGILEDEDPQICNRTKCPSNDYARCETSGRCIPQNWVCDLDYDCADKSDEPDSCPKTQTSCTAQQFHCTNKRCIAAGFVCNQVDDCGDNSDESSCQYECASTEFKCNNSGRCLPASYHCDGVDSCGDNSDEQDCGVKPNSGCTVNEFECGSGDCVSRGFRCDGTVDCINGADEVNCSNADNTTGHVPCPGQGFGCVDLDDTYRCLSTHSRCDKIQDCKNNEDEKNCPTDCPWPNFTCDVSATNESRLCLDINKVCDTKVHCVDGTDEGLLCGAKVCENRASECSHICHNTPKGYRCSCPPGGNLTLADDQRNCQVVEPCGWGSCSQLCSVHGTQSVCHCLEQYELGVDKFSCKPVDSRTPYIIFSNRHEIRRFDLGGSNYASLLSALPNTIALDFHYNKSYVFWTDVNEDAIYRGKMEGNSMSNVETIVRVGLAVTEGLAVDWIADNIYWVESQLDQIEVARLDGSNQTTLIAGNMTNPRAIALDPRVGLLFWTDWHAARPRIERCGMDGNERHVIYELNKMSGAGWPNGMTLDFVAHRVYWIDARSQSIHTVKYDGTDHRLVLKDRQLISHPFAISLFGDRVFWTDWKTNSLITANKWNGTAVTQIQRTITQPFDLQVYHSTRQPGAINPCGSNNGGCSHLCLISSKLNGKLLTATCRCPALMKMDKGKCVEQEQFLMYAEPKQIRGVDVARPYYNVMPAMTSGIEKATSLDFDYAEKRFYWTDAEKHTVNRAFLNSSLVEIVLDANLTNPECLAVDWSSRNLYLTSYDSVSGAIHVSSLSGAYRIKLTTSTVLNQPTSIALHPEGGVMYVADAGLQKIFLYNMDGTGGAVIQSGIEAKSLSVDQRGERLYWIQHTKSGAGVIQSSSLDGTTVNRRVRSVETGLYSIGISQGSLYYSVKTPKSESGLSSNITRLSLRIGNGEPEFVRSTDFATLSIRMYDAGDQPDITSNPCQSNGGCEQLCLLAGSLNGRTRRVCRCTAGFELGQDGQTCQALEPFLLYSTSSQLIGRALQDLNNVALPPVSNISNISAIDYDPVTGSVFWVDSKTTEITRIQRDLTLREVIVKTGPDIVEGLAVDWLARNVYWTDQAFGTIQVARTDGMFRYVLVSTGLEKPRSIVVHPMKGQVFWTDIGQGSPSEPRFPRIERANLDGTDRRVIFNATNRELPYGMALDFGRERLYWCDRALKNIMRMDLEGGNVIRVRTNVSGCYHVAVDDQYVYWTAREPNSMPKTYSIMKADLNNVRDDVEVVRNGLKSRITDLKIYAQHPSASPAKVENPCSSNSSNRKNCSQLCFFNGESGRCACAYGKLDVDGLGCVDGETFLLFSSINRIESINIVDTDDRNSPNKPIENPTKMKNVIGLTFHHPEQLVFFSDIHNRNIQQVYFNGTGMRVVATGVGSAEGLAYEEVYNRLYWTSYTNSSIKYVGLDRAPNVTETKTVVQLTEDDHPRAIVIDSCASRMFWTNWNSKRPCIQRAFLQGWNVVNIITTDIRVPNGLAIDHRGQRLYWSDARLDKIERCDFDGRNRKIIVSRVPQHVFALAQYGDYLYWTDWIMHSVVMASKYDGTVVKALRKTEQQPMGIVAVAKDTNECSLNPCKTANGGCDSVCQIDDRGNVVCSCFGSGVLHADKKTCIVKCDGDNDFVCPSGDDCVPLEMTCDGQNNCPGGEDENPDFCNTRLCPANYFRCYNNRCAQWHRVCDGVNDCGDLSDEQNCGACPIHKMLCSERSNHCFERSKRCDGHPDCPMGQDEIHCNETECPPKSVGRKDTPFLIPCNTTTACISPSWKCDGENDCWDNSDEKDCPPAATCGAGDFQCHDDKRCISVAWKCDKTADCADQSDEVDCGFQCESAEFQCKKSGLCINKMWECDGQSDCDDGSDEHTDCKKPSKCPTDGEYFRCHNSSRCVAKEQVCDGIPDCADHSDESRIHGNCDTRLCADNQFTCKSGLCIDRTFQCDRYHDCEKGEDEENCTYRECTALEFRCASGQCIPGVGRCDKYPDCFDLSDESEAICKPPGPCDGLFACKKGNCINETLVCDRKNDCGDWSDELTCGINECSYKTCDHHCTDRKLGYECTCETGYQLQSDGRTCEDVNECEEHDLCSHYCLNTRGGYRCSCLEGFALTADRRTCRALPPVLPYFVITNRYYLRNMSTYGSASLLYRSSINAVAVDYDWKTQSIYWSDVTNHEANISRMFFNGTGHQVLHNTTLSNPDGIALDWYGDNLYWCDKTTDTIEVSKSDGRFRKVLVSTGLQEPRALVVHPSRGYLFYTDWGDRAHLGRIGMDGTERRDLITDDIGWPNALALDYVRDKIYWADARLDYIKMADLDGSNKKVILKKNLPHVFALTVFGGEIFWTDWEQKAVNRANKLNGRNHTIVRAFIHRPMDIQVVHPSRQMITTVNPCENNGGCMNLCLIKPGGQGRTCACPENHVLHGDGVSCVANCTSSQFLCRGSSKCIPFWTYCDEQNDCGDFSDEPSTCKPRVCRTSGLFQCHDAEKTRHCIPPSQICDGYFHCHDKSDELNCANYTCLPNQFKCELESKCIPESRRCDGAADCRSGSDEQGCAKPFCDDNHIMCKEGDKSKCIPYMWKCDGAKDCDDGSDEPADCHTVSCKPGYFKCNKTGQCLPQAWMCDGQNDCADGDDTDEPDSCNSTKCESTYVKCDNNRCIPGRWKCDYRNDCGDNSDEIGCDPRNCSESEFKCLSDLRCISGHWRCNGEPDCVDESDEKNCTNVKCAPDEFRCEESNFCVPKSWRCDGRDDCVDNSDEADCNATCRENEFRCGTGQCIPASWRCDGTADCQVTPDDEHNCTDCPSHRFSCGDGSCILYSQVCDNVLQCQNKVDEISCPASCQDANQFMCTHTHQCVNKTLVCDYAQDCLDGSDEDPELCKEDHIKNCERCQTGKCYSSVFSGNGFLSAAFNAFFSERCVCPKGTNTDKTGTECHVEDTCRQHGTCDQLCIPHKGSPWSHTCHCEKGYSMASGKDKKPGVHNCLAFGPDTYILALADESIYAVNTSSLEKKMVYSIGEHLDAMDVQIGGDNDVTIFGLKRDARWIVSARVNADIIPPRRPKRAAGQSTERIRLDAVALRDVAVDWLGKRLYYTDPGAGAGTIEVADFDGKNRLTLLDSDLRNVDKIIVNPYNNTLRIFWTQTGLHPRIESAKLDGSDRQIVVASDLILPTDLALDYPNRRLYWVDVKKKSVETANLDGSDRRVVKAFSITQDAPYRIDVFESDLYITTYTHRRLLKMNKFKPDRMETLDAFKAEQHLAIQPQRQQTNVTACDRNPCGVGVLCFLVPTKTGYVCRCPNGKEMSDSPGPAPVCTIVKPVIRYNCTDDFCQNGGTCLMTERNRPKCKCLQNHDGDHCEHDACRGVCANNGTCLVEENKSTCTCPLAYGGERCDVDKCRNHCNKNGNCLIDATGKPLCRCDFSHQGERCNETKADVCANYCMNGGECSKSTNSSGRPHCNCPDGVRGDRCDRCDNLVCGNSGLCTIRPDGARVCSCLPGYIDTTNCFKSGCDNCKNNAKCIWNNGVPDCQCSSARYRGSQCEIDKCDGYCQNDGICSFTTSLSCKCLIGYRGGRCEQAVTHCSNNYCKNGGTCSSGGHSGNDQFGPVICRCPQGYGGKQCELITDCAILKCQNNGLCQPGRNGEVVCKCTAGTTGDRCTEASIRKCKDYCFNEGICQNCHLKEMEAVCSNCSCHEGWSGDRCQLRNTVLKPGASRSNSGITAAIVAPFVIVLIMLLGVAAYFVRKRRYHTKLFAHMRMSDTGASNVEINNPIYRPSPSEEDESAFMFDGESTTNFSNPLYGSPFGDNAAVPTDERRELLDNDQLKVSFNPEDDNANSRTSFA